MNHFIIKDREEVKQLMKLALSTGESMLQNGAETYRVEDTMVRMCTSRKNVKNVDSFVTQTGMFITMEYDNEVFSNFIRVKSRTIDLNKINSINEFSRKFVSTNISVDQGIQTIEEINNIKSYSKLTKALCGSAAAAFFCIMYGGSFGDFISSFIVSIIVIGILFQIGKYNLTFFVENFLGAFLASLFAYFTMLAGIGDNIDKIIIGSIMYLVPGVSITNAIRDTMSGDSLSGLSRGMEAIFSALAIAFGVGLVLNLYMKGVI